MNRTILLSTDTTRRDLIWRGGGTSLFDGIVLRITIPSVSCDPQVFRLWMRNKRTQNPSVPYPDTEFELIMVGRIWKLKGHCLFTNNQSPMSLYVSGSRCLCLRSPDDWVWSTTGLIPSDVPGHRSSLVSRHGWSGNEPHRSWRPRTSKQN